jgi:chitin deacetylase
MEAFPKIAMNGWKFESLARLLGSGQAYQNSFDADSEVKPVNLMTGQTNTTMMSKNASMIPTPGPSSTSASVPNSVSNLSAHGDDSLGTSTAGNLAATTDYPTTDPLVNAAAAPRGQTQSLKWILSTVLGGSLITAVILWV